MKTKTHIPIGKTGEYTHVLVPAIDYDFQADSRLLIPFSIEERIGFVDKNGDVVIKAQYAMYYGDFMKETDLVIVAKYYLYGLARRDGRATAEKRPVYGVINIKGEEVIPVEFFKIIPLHLPNQNLFIVQNKEEQYALVNEYYHQIIPFGQYKKMEFCSDFSVLRIIDKEGNEPKWGIINRIGEVKYLIEL